ncbi:ribonuclease H-like domain-containing protein [Tanacetum coccineum]
MTNYNEPTTSQLLAKLLAQLGTLGIKNTGTPTPVAYHAGPTPYTGPSHANQGLIYYATGPGLSNVVVGPGSSLESAQYHPSAQSHVVGPPPGFSYPVVHHQPTYVPAQPMSQPVSAFGPALAHVLAVSQPTQTELSGQPTNLPHAFSIVTLQDLASGAWNMDTGASSHLNNSVNSLSEIFNTCMYPSISVSDGHSIPVTNTGHSILPTPTKSLHLNNVLITPHIVKNLISIRQFVRDDNCTIEFDAFGFSVKDFLTRWVLLRCDSIGDLYPVTAPSPIPHAFLVSQHTWHQRLGHPKGEVLRHLVSFNFISYNKEKPPVLCHACHLGKHVRLLFVSSGTVISSCFDIIHSDVWTSPIPSLSGLNIMSCF